MGMLSYVIGWMFFLSIIVGSILMGNAYLTGATAAGWSTQQAQASYIDARAWMESTLKTYVANNPNAAVTSSAFSSGYSSGSTKAIVTVRGDTTTTGTQLTAANVEENASVNERRVALDLSVLSTHPARAYITHRLVYRVYDGIVQYLGEQYVGAVSDSRMFAGADTGGCAGTGAGCDVNDVQAQDSQTIGAGLSCTLGSNSGSCPSGNVFDKSQYGNRPWNNQQTQEGIAP